MIDVVELTKRYGGRAVIDDLSFTVREGTITGFLGLNGAGKTTTLRIILGLAHPSSGHTLIGGEQPNRLRRPAEVFGAVLDRDTFYPTRSAEQHLAILAQLADLPRTRVDEVLDDVGLGDDGPRLVREFSLGMRQRLRIAAALLGRPRLLVLDEPANGMDPVGMRWLRALLLKHVAAGGTVFLSSHLLTEIQHLASEVVIIHRGRLVESATVAQILSSVSRSAGRTVDGPFAPTFVLSQPGQERPFAGSDGLVVPPPLRLDPPCGGQPGVLLASPQSDLLTTVLSRHGVRHESYAGRVFVPGGDPEQLAKLLVDAEVPLRELVPTETTRDPAWAAMRVSFAQARGFGEDGGPAAIDLEAAFVARITGNKDMIEGGPPDGGQRAKSVEIGNDAPQSTDAVTQRGGRS